MDLSVEHLEILLEILESGIEDLRDSHQHLVHDYELKDCDHIKCINNTRNRICLAEDIMLIAQFELAKLKNEEDNDKSDIKILDEMLKKVKLTQTIPYKKCTKCGEYKHHNDY